MAVLVEQQDAAVNAVEQSAMDVEQNTKAAYVRPPYSPDPSTSKNYLGSITPPRLLFTVRVFFSAQTRCPDCFFSALISERKMDLLWDRCAHLCRTCDCPRRSVWDKEVASHLYYI
jgi:hypothetical protein